MIRFSMALVVCWLLALSTAARAAVIADSVIDFSGTQGQAGWSYGYVTSLTGPLVTANIGYSVAESAWKRTDVGPNPPWTTITGNFMHPNNTSPGGTNWVTREYVYTGPTASGVQITGQFEKTSDGSAGQGDGVNGYIELNHTTTLASFLGVNTTTNQFTSPVVVGTLNTGDVLDFIVDPIANDSFDHTQFPVTISGVVPEPSTWVLGALAACGLLALPRRFRTR